MFAKLFNAVAAAAAIAGVMSTPLRARMNRAPELVARNDVSFNNWNGIQSLSGFDNFYGSSNFGGSLQVSETTIIEQDSQLVCHSQSVEIIQQRLLVLQEMAKRIITEQICEVETQTIVFEQFHVSLSSFGHDIRRHSSNSVGYDKSISSHLSHIINSDGSLSNNDLGFTGHDNGKQYVVPTGNNWNDSTSPSIVSSAYNATKSAVSSSKSKGNSTTSAIASSTAASSTVVSSTASSSSTASAASSSASA